MNQPQSGSQQKSRQDEQESPFFLRRKDQFQHVALSALPGSPEASGCGLGRTDRDRRRIDDGKRER